MNIQKWLVYALFLLKTGQIGALSALEIEQIGLKVWHNEAAGKEELLVFWHPNEDFPSLGIGHNIWLPASQKDRFAQGFPVLCEYLKKNGVKLPAWLEKAKNHGAPWSGRDDFYKDYARRNELRQILAQTVALQTQFMIDLMSKKLPLIIDATPKAQRARVKRNINLMLSTSKGTYALVDYLNFKGDGLNPREESNGERWGLYAVLLDMPDKLNKNNVNKAFAICAGKKLLTRIKNSGPDYKLLPFLQGWMKRIGTYID